MEVVDTLLAGFGCTDGKDTPENHLSTGETPQSIAEVHAVLGRHESHSLSVMGGDETTAQTS